MKREYKKIIAAFLPIPLFLAITLCCCLDEKALADEIHSNCSSEHAQESHDLEKNDHSEHKEHSEGDHSCSCPKHLSFLSAQSADIVFVSTSQMLAKNFMADLRFESIIFLASVSNQSQGPPLQDYFDHSSLPIYLKNSNLRL